MLEIFVFGSLAFWLLVVAEIVVLCVSVNRDNGVVATISFVGFLAVLQLFGGINVVEFINSHRLYTLFGVLGYLGLGIAWGFIKWTLFCHERVNEYDNQKQKFFESNHVSENTTVVPDNLRSRWLSHLDGWNQEQEYEQQPLQEKALIRKNKARWLRWASLWPFSIALYLGKDLILHIWQKLYKMVANMLQRISDSIYAKTNIEEDLKLPD